MLKKYKNKLKNKPKKYKNLNKLNNKLLITKKKNLLEEDNTTTLETTITTEIKTIKEDIKNTTIAITAMLNNKNNKNNLNNNNKLMMDGVKLNTT